MFTIKTLYELIYGYTPPEWTLSSKPWKLPKAEQDALLNTFIANVNNELAKTDEAVRLYRLDDIVFDMPTFQPRVEMSEETIKRYHDAYENDVEMPPVDIATVIGYSRELTEKQKRDAYRLFCNPFVPNLCLLDGFHRYKAIERAGTWKQYIAAINHGDMSLNDAMYFSVRQNIANGLSYTKADMKNVFRIYMETGQYKLRFRNVKSYRKIAKELSFLTYKTVQRWTEEMFPDIDKEICRQHSRRQSKTDTELEEHEEGALNMKHFNNKEMKNFNNKLAAVGRVTDLFNTEYDIKYCEGQILELLIATRKKRGADVGALSALMNEYRDY